MVIVEGVESGAVTNIGEPRIRVRPGRASVGQCVACEADGTVADRAALVIIGCPMTSAYGLCTTACTQLSGIDHAAQKQRGRDIVLIGPSVTSQGNGVCTIDDQHQAQRGQATTQPRGRNPNVVGAVNGTRRQQNAEIDVEDC